jgi:hypothetical protein
LFQVRPDLRVEVRLLCELFLELPAQSSELLRDRLAIVCICLGNDASAPT